MMPKPRVALFIDAENASPGHASDYLDHCRTLGKPTIARCYGHAAALKGWEAAISRHHFMPVQTPPGTGKANASDFALTIDAVSMLHRNLFDHAVIVSSDADFTLLAIHIREHGKGVDGIGGENAKPSLRTAFDRFVTVSAPPAPAPTPPATPPATAPLKAAPAATSLPPEHSTASFLEAARKLLSPRATTTLSNMGKQLRASMGNSYPTGKLSNHLGKHPTVFRIEGNDVQRLK